VRDIRIYTYYKVRRRVLHIIKPTDWEKKDWDEWTLDGRETLQLHCPSVCFECYLILFFLSSLFLSLSLPLFFFVAHEEMRKLIETMPHPTRVDSLSWKLKYFYESCTALEHIVVPEQKLIRVIDQMGMEIHTLSLYLCSVSLLFDIFPLDLIIISRY
jgi:hypothetical protein